MGRRKKVSLARKEERARYIAIDPGLSGAIAVLEGPDNLEVFPTPTIKSGKGSRRDIDFRGLYTLLLECDCNNAFAVIEQVGAMPGQGVTSMFRFGESFGILKAMVFTVGISHTFVHPATWKKAHKLTGKGKDASIALASSYWPHVTFGRNTNLADAALMALYARRRGL